MRIEGSSIDAYASQRHPASTAHRTSALADRAGAGLVSTAQADFTSMTRLEMRSWVNGQIRSGELSLDDSRPFMAMTMKIPVGHSMDGESTLATDPTRYDFKKVAHDGIRGALLRNDQATLKMLESALSIMQGQQGRTIGVDARV